MLALFDREKLDEEARHRAGDVGSTIGNLLFKGDMQPVLEANVELGGRHHPNGSEDWDSNKDNFGIFYWVLTSLTGTFQSLWRREEDDSFLLKYCLEHHLLSVFKVIGSEHPRLDDLRRIISENPDVMSAITPEGRTADGLISVMIQAHVFDYYGGGGEGRVGLSVSGMRILECLTWLEDYKGSIQSLICALIDKKSLRAGTLLGR